MTNNQHKFGIPMTAAQYASEWIASSTALADAGHYSWMESQLEGGSTTLEVGCGSGMSTYELAKSGRRILAVESNAVCTSNAKSYLVSRGISTEVIELAECENLFPWIGAQVKLVTHDILSDELKGILKDQSFDAIACWLLGSHPEHIGLTLRTSIRNFDGSEPAKYREQIQKRCYELGEKILTPSGRVQLTDRAAIRSWNDKDKMRSHIANVQASIAGSGYQFGKSDCMLRKLSEGLNQSRIQYVVTQAPADSGVLVLTSSIARRI